uniref:E3 ubiquitin-protein ligase n=1 Tax=Eptatretus burgeri TaxID=7764 RepID=A0A8C4Q8S0_EPTBU
MGSLLGRQQAGVEEVDIALNSAYRFPLKAGNYFSNHFYMGGEKFETSSPESYLFGENSDLNFLGCRPFPFPYSNPPPNEPVRALHSLVNIRKDSLRLVKHGEEVKSEDGGVVTTVINYNIEFTFDCDADVAITLYYQATEEITSGGIRYVPKTAQLTSQTVTFKRGVAQQFCLTSHVIDLSNWSSHELTFDSDKALYPLVVHAAVVEATEHTGHTHILMATFDKNADGIFVVKPLKQKQVVDGVCYLLQEIYGIENKANRANEETIDDEDGSDNSGECVVCLSDVRDTLILPCRHLCLCNACADTLRYQANNCPICRLPFRALLQIRAMRKKTLARLAAPTLPAHTPSRDKTAPLPPGYEAVSLLEVLNGAQPGGPLWPTCGLQANLATLPLPEVATQTANPCIQAQSTVGETSTRDAPCFVSVPLRSSSRSRDRGRGQRVCQKIQTGQSTGHGQNPVEPPLCSQEQGSMKQCAYVALCVDTGVENSAFSSSSTSSTSSTVSSTGDTKGVPANELAGDTASHFSIQENATEQRDCLKGTVGVAEDVSVHILPP